MRPARAILEFIRNLADAFYRSLLKLSINAHQVIAHWRIRINRKRREATTTSAEATTRASEVELTDQPYKTSSESHIQFHQQQPHTQSRPRRLTSQQFGLSTSKTPDSRRSKIYSLLRRLSIRNFMDYCVIALNEASSSSSANKFDLSSCERPVWLLGKQYELPRDADKLSDDIKSKIWITYRRNFPPIDDSARYTTDRGFGCMIRCGQMVLANALLCKNLGRDWRWSPDGLETNPDIYVRILKLFQDKEECPYSIHNIVRIGQQEGKHIGEWFGPNTIAQALKRLASTLSTESPMQSSSEPTPQPLPPSSISGPDGNQVLISIDAALDNVVVIDEIKSRFLRSITETPDKSESSKNGQGKIFNLKGDKSSESAEAHPKEWVPGILFIQLRLGLTKINPIYFSALRKTFQFENSLGIIGGRPNHALYLIGYTDDDIIYLDPHITQQYIDFDSGEVNDERFPEDLRSLPLDSTYHCAFPEKMNIDRLDPSLALCFYFDSEREFDDWCSSSNNLLIKSEQAPMFEITPIRSTCPLELESDEPNMIKGDIMSGDEFEMLG